MADLSRAPGAGAHGVPPGSTLEREQYEPGAADL